MVRTTAQIPFLGADVHYVAQASGTPEEAGATPVPVVKHAAKITAAGGPPVLPGGYPSRTARQAAERDVKVSLVVFGPYETTNRWRVPYDPAGTVPGTWHWPEPRPAEA